MFCDQRVGLKIARGRGGANIMQDGAVDLQHGTGVEKNLCPRIKGHYPKKGFSHSETYMFKSLCIV